MSVGWEIYVRAGQGAARFVESGEADSLRAAVGVLLERVPGVEPAAAYAYGAVHRDPGDGETRPLRANRMPGARGVWWSGM